jgi:hypothetical protein
MDNGERLVTSGVTWMILHPLLWGHQSKEPERV